MHELTKPRVRPLGERHYAVQFASGARAEIHRCPDSNGCRGNEWTWFRDGEMTSGRHCWSAEQALAEAWMDVLPPPPPVEIDRTELAAMINKAERCATASAKLMRKLLRMRTGLSWSVTGGRGTARSWLRIDSPPKRRVDSMGRPDRDGYMPLADQVLLGVILGRLPHYQGESIRTESGVRESYMWRISGHEAPEDLRVEPPSWD